MDISSEGGNECSAPENPNPTSPGKPLDGLAALETKKYLV